MTVDVLEGPVVDDTADQAADQAAVDAEFVAIVLAERPWGEGEPAPRTPPPAAATGTRRVPPPSGPGPLSEQPDDLVPAVGETPQVRRRTGPGPRSPPRRSTPVTDPTRR
ncbi:hypothetical protein [Actinomycetospora straminea]|uniref:Uncharacterized protein n=1 Tax=Actinomycetospora straminea TaxID=663607 RepID=A0ABP9EA22_9PSEU|nr:hypothetical protein [Actinomycetospora straminea]MDD7935398.1 hypothetical protein [Actinomycetospora straminea]